MPGDGHAPAGAFWHHDGAAALRRSLSHVTDGSVLTDAEIVRLGRERLAASGAIEDLLLVETMIRQVCSAPVLDLQALIGLLERGRDLLGCRSTRLDEGVLFSGKLHWVEDDGEFVQAGFSSKRTDQEVRALNRRTVAIDETRRVATEWAESKDKLVIGMTPGGAWLDDWLEHRLPGYLDDKEKEGIWDRSSKIFVESLSGEVDVFLAYPWREKTYRSVEARPLFDNPNVTRIDFHILHAVPEEVKAKVRSPAKYGTKALTFDFIGG